MIRLVLFDIDGTLIRTGGAGVRAFGLSLRDVFELHDGTAGIRFAGRTDSSLVREILMRHEIEPTAERFQAFLDRYVFWLDHLLGCTEGAPCAGAESFVSDIQSLTQSPLLGLLTGNVRLGAEIKLRHYKLWQWFVTGAFGDDHEDRNCLASIAQRRASDLVGREVLGREILVIGDTPLDIECGRAIGARTLAVATGGSTLEELQIHQPDWLVRDLREVTAAQVCR